jgi:hypothetical protein
MVELNLYSRNNKPINRELKKHFTVKFYQEKKAVYKKNIQKKKSHMLVVIVI